MKSISNKIFILYFSAGDFLWVVASLLLIALDLWVTTPEGIW